jgi:hypothetical protein
MSKISQPTELPSKKDAIFRIIFISVVSAILISVVLLAPIELSPLLNRIFLIIGPVLMFSGNVALVSDFRLSNKAARNIEWCISELSKLDEERESIENEKVAGLAYGNKLTSIGSRRKAINLTLEEANTFRNRVIIPIADISIAIMGVGLLLILATI